MKLEEMEMLEGDVPRKGNVDRNVAPLIVYTPLVDVPRKGNVDRNPGLKDYELMLSDVPRKGNVDRNAYCCSWQPYLTGRSPQGERG